MVDDKTLELVGPSRQMMIPPSVIVDHILPFLDRETFDNCVIANKEIFQTSQTVSNTPWPQTCLDVGEEISCVAFARSNKALACGCEDGNIHIWNKTGKKHSTSAHQSLVLTLVFSPDETFLASGSVDCTVRLWRLGPDFSMSIKSIVLTGHKRPVHSLSFIPNTDILLSSAHESTVRLWDVSKETCTVELEHRAKVESVAVSKSGRHLATATWDGTIRLFEVSQDAKVRKMIELGKALPLTKIEFSDDEKFLYGLKGFRIRRWNVNDGNLTFLMGNGVQRVYSVAISHVAKLVAYSDRDGSIRVCGLGDSLDTAVFREIFYGNSYQCSLQFSPDGRTLLAGGDDGSLKLWNA